MRLLVALPLYRHGDIGDVSRHPVAYEYRVVVINDLLNAEVQKVVLTPEEKVVAVLP